MARPTPGGSCVASRGSLNTASTNESRRASGAGTLIIVGRDSYLHSLGASSYAVGNYHHGGHEKRSAWHGSLRSLARHANQAKRVPARNLANAVIVEVSALVRSGRHHDREAQTLTRASPSAHSQAISSDRFRTGIRVS